MLPGDDGAWDEGVSFNFSPPFSSCHIYVFIYVCESLSLAHNTQIVSSSTPATVSSPLTSHMSKFALLCQAARLLGQVLTYVATEREGEGETEVEAQLDRTLHSMLKVAMGVKEPDYDQITFIFRYVFFLHFTKCVSWVSSAHYISAYACHSFFIHPPP